MLKKEHTNRQHAIFSASGADKWLNCPASLLMEQGYPNTSSEASKEGTLAHETAENCLTTGKHPKSFTDNLDMIRHVQSYIDYVQEIAGIDNEILTECRVSYADSIDAPDGFGTCDNIIYDKTNHILHIIDFKYGYGEVSPKGNNQLSLYALGALSLFNPMTPIKSVRLHIHQPRIENISWWECDMDYLISFAEKAKKAVKMALVKDPVFNPTEKGCKWCKARANCKALMNYTSDLITHGFDDLTQLDANTISNEELALILKNKELITNFLKDIEARAYKHTIIDGGCLDGFKVVNKKSRAVWKDEAESVLKEKLGDKAYTKKVITITEAKKIMPLNEIVELTHKKTNGYDLVPEADRRKAVDVKEEQNILDDFDIFSD